MAVWLTVFLATLAALVIAGAAAAISLVAGACAITDRLLAAVLGRLMHASYTANPFGTLGVMRRLGPQTFLETMIRAGQGTALSRPMGTPLHFSPWDKLLFQPVYVTPRLPTDEKRPVATEVTIGRQAQRPLRLEIPLVITGMSFGGALSVEAKVALAQAANAVGTATNSGESYLQEERDVAERLILQHHRGQWRNSTMKRPELLHSGDAIEIHFGQGAQAACAMTTAPASIDARMRAVYGLEVGETAAVSTRFAGVDGPEAVIGLIRDLKQRFPVPVGVKIGASDYLEDDLDVFCEGGIDFITIDGAEGGTHGGPAALQDDLGLPTMHALARCDRHLRARERRGQVSILAAGGLASPGQFAKALAIGADAVYIGTAAMLALVADQLPKVLPGRPPFQLFLQSAPERWRTRLDVSLAATGVSNYLRSVLAEMVFIAQATGRQGLAELSRDDLVALDRDTAEICGVRLAWRAPDAHLPQREDHRLAQPSEGEAQPPAQEVVH